MIEPIPEPGPDAVPPEGGTDSRGWAVGAHLSPWVAGFIGPLVVRLARKDDPYVEHHSREALNYHLSLMIYVLGWIVVSTIVILVLAAAGAVVVGIIIFGLGFLGLMYLGFVPPIIGAIRASNGDTYHYHLSIRFVKEPVPR